MRAGPRELAAALGLLALWGLLLGSPLLAKGFPVDGHDFRAHITWGGHFARQFRDGEIYPRWLADHNEGLGSPTFFFYPSLPFWLTAGLPPLFPGETAPVSALASVATAMLALRRHFGRDSEGRRRVLRGEPGNGGATHRRRCGIRWYGRGRELPAAR